MKTPGPAAVPSAAEDFKLVQDITVKLSVEIDQMKVSVQTLSDLMPNSVLASTKRAGDHVDICVNGCRVAQGEIVPLGSRAGVRITEVFKPGVRKPGGRA
jgi:flagellar motor switch protein FliN